MEGLVLRVRIVLLAWLHFRSRPVIFLRHFSYKDIKRATNDFHRVIVGSPHGVVYKAQFCNGHAALVKEIRVFGQEENAFYKEVQLLGRLHHRHVIALSGFSIGRKRFLVFENVENGSLKEHLNDPLKTPLNWRTRLQIAIDVAAALEYLQFFCVPPMYDVSINSSTIMLDQNFHAKISDIGILGSGEKHVTTSGSSCSKDCTGQPCGNIIKQLGLLILELITGQSSEIEGGDLVRWVQNTRFPKFVHNMIDPDLGTNYDHGELRTLLAIARLCLKSVDKPNAFTPQILRYLQNKIGIV